MGVSVLAAKHELSSTWRFRRGHQAAEEAAALMLFSVQSLRYHRWRFDPFGVVPLWTAKNSGYRFGNYRLIKSKLWALANVIAPR